MDDVNEVNENEVDFELDHERVAELRRQAQQQARAQANVVDGDTIHNDEDED